jgi:hypothetical protein
MSKIILANISTTNRPLALKLHRCIGLGQYMTPTAFGVARSKSVNRRCQNHIELDCLLILTNNLTTNRPLNLKLGRSIGLGEDPY